MLDIFALFYTIYERLLIYNIHYVIHKLDEYNFEYERLIEIELAKTITHCRGT